MPIAITFDLTILVLTGILYGIWLLTVQFFKQLLKWIDTPLKIGLSLIIIILILIILFYHFSAIADLAETIFKIITNGKI